MYVLAAFALLFLLANLTDFNTITPILVSMIEIQVGVLLLANGNQVRAWPDATPPRRRFTPSR